MLPKQNILLNCYLEKQRIMITWHKAFNKKSKKDLNLMCCLVMMLLLLFIY